MTATDELRRMLDERRVEWDYGITGSSTTRFSVNGIDLTFTPMRDGLVCSTILTPEQAIAATLGPAIGGFLTADGTLHVTCGKLPERIEVTLPDSRGREVHSARVYEYERREECHDTDEDANDFCCSECGARLYVSTSDVYTMMLGDEKTILEHPNFCPNCGAKVVDG